MHTELYWSNELFSEENEAPLFEARKVAGSATYKQSKTVWNCFVVKAQYVYSVNPVVTTKRDCLVIILSTKLPTAPLI